MIRQLQNMTLHHPTANKKPSRHREGITYDKHRELYNERDFKAYTVRETAVYRIVNEDFEDKYNVKIALLDNFLYLVTLTHFIVVWLRISNIPSANAKGAQLPLVIRPPISLVPAPPANK